MTAKFFIFSFKYYIMTKWETFYEYKVDTKYYPDMNDIFQKYPDNVVFKINYISIQCWESQAQICDKIVNELKKRNIPYRLSIKKLPNYYE
ncbi:hypothetical protein SBV1_gp47 [Sulfolobales Beppu virus 1]|nr:hypothetical protein SBV1_gp47 [Sulfolobales Beppu virus 1]